jgi:superfamily II DNA/RNA helicase
MNLVSFDSLGLEKTLVDVLRANNFVSPTPIQQLTIGPILEDKDILAQAETGSGKTGAFVIPLINKLLFEKDKALIEENPKIGKVATPYFIIMSPTRELAQQTYTVCQTFGKSLGIESACIIGGESITAQKDLLKTGVDILIATPGRLKDLFLQNFISFKNTKGIVLDEADRLLDMGFKDEIQFLLRKIPSTRQFLMFSATIHMEVLNIAYRFHSVPIEIKLNNNSMIVEKINHTVTHLGDDEKMLYLVGILKKYPDTYTMIFSNTKTETMIIATWLQNLGFKAMAITGDLPQNKRSKMIEDFRSKKIQILVCTDVAARGLDIKDIELVVNYDLPQDASNYVHRIGRTGRAGSSGRAISFCAFRDCENLDAVENFLNSKIPTEQVQEEMLNHDIGRRPRLDDKKEIKPQFKKEFKKPLPPVQQITPVKKPIPVSSPLVIRTREFTSTSLKKAKKQVLPFFPIKNIENIDYKILKEGKRSFFGLGPKNITYKFFLKPKYKEIILTLLENIIQKTGFDLKFEIIEVQINKLRVIFTGTDEKLLFENDGELLGELEFLIKLIIPRFVPSLDLRIEFTSQNYKKFEKDNLENLAKRMKEKSLRSKAPVFIQPLGPKQRYVIHQFFSADPNFQTVSIGQGYLKKIKVIPNISKN